MLIRLLLIVFLPSAAYAQSVLLSNADIAEHQTKKTGVNYVVKQLPKNQENLPKPIQGVELSVPAYLYSSTLPSGAGNYDGLPSCSESNVRYLIRSESEDSFETLNVVVYQFNDSEQKQKAQSLGAQAVPYIEGALANPYRPEGDTAQTLIRALGIKCLPTRIKSVQKDGEKAFEYSEGKTAWAKEESK